MSNTNELETKGGKEPIVDAAEIKGRMDDLSERLDEAMDAVKKTPSATEIEGLKSEVAAVKSAVDSITDKMPSADYKGLIDALEKRVDELQTGAALTAGKSNGTPDGIKSIVDAVEASDIYKSIFGPDGQKGRQICSTGAWSEKIDIPSLAAVKAAAPVVIADLAGGTTEVFRPGILEAREWAMDLVSRIPSQITAGATRYTVPKETVVSRYGAWVSTLAADLDGDPTPKSQATFVDVDGLMVGSVVRFYNASGVVLGSAVVVSYDEGTKVVTFQTDSLTWDATTGWRVSSENYGATAELGTKPAGTIGDENESFDMRTLASIVPVSINAINTRAGLMSLIERKLQIRDRRNMSRHLLYGDNSAKQMQGLRTYSGAQSYLWSSGETGDNQIDAIMRAINLIPWGVPIAVIMNQLDLPSLQLLKGSDGHYLTSGNFGMWNLTQVGQAWFLGPYELVFDFANAQGDFTPINFSGASEVADQNTASLAWGYINTDFQENVIRARYEKTACHAILDANEYVVAEWDSAPS